LLEQPVLLIGMGLLGAECRQRIPGAT